MIATFTLDGIITGVNRGLEVTLGWFREELIGRHHSKLATAASLALADESTRTCVSHISLWGIAFLYLPFFCRVRRYSAMTRVFSRAVRPGWRASLSSSSNTSPHTGIVWSP